MSKKIYAEDVNIGDYLADSFRALLEGRDFSTLVQNFFSLSKPVDLPEDRHESLLDRVFNSMHMVLLASGFPESLSTKAADAVSSILYPKDGSDHQNATREFTEAVLDIQDLYVRGELDISASPENVSDHLYNAYADSVDYRNELTDQ
jgi:hypothetical protein